jgi:hypothetical protein
VAELEARLEKEGVDFPVEHYVSPVLGKRIRVWPPKGPFLAAVLLASILVGALGEILGRKRARQGR